MVVEVRVPELQRHVRTAKFLCEGGESLELLDAVLMHLKDDCMVLSGFERVDDGLVKTDFAQTWVLTEPIGDTPEATRGPAFLR